MKRLFLPLMTILISAFATIQAGPTSWLGTLRTMWRHCVPHSNLLFMPACNELKKAEKACESTQRFNLFQYTAVLRQQVATRPAVPLSPVLLQTQHKLSAALLGGAVVAGSLASCQEEKDDAVVSAPAYVLSDLDKKFIEAIATKNYTAIGMCYFRGARITDDNVDFLIQKMDPLIPTAVEANAPDQEGKTWMHHAIRLHQIKLLQMLLERGADINIPDKAGWTPLHMAAWMGRPEVVAFLLANGADPCAYDINGKQPHEVARKYKNHEVADLLKDAAEKAAVPPTIS